ncbi:hypothetical protein BXY39_2039 [Eilatimonas milleporae]|uniref:Uncharacterized protein n=1 Tax=Eilatimonas milleporae TaxID=911205 RepID=A0A3M0CG40_9PROT|nr:hypothetical protein BXY39_2039 [Eilatimonas milleporae]
MKSIGFFRTFFVKNGSMVKKGSVDRAVFRTNPGPCRKSF